MSETKAASPVSSKSSPVKTNWPLIIGGALVSLIFLLAMFGPSLAPKDPTAHKLIIQIEDEWMTPPYPAFTPGYPLGSDNLGRDLYSWLLWSVRPTMILVVIVAGLRMALGLLIGVGAGWSDGWGARVFDTLIAAALSVPALIASLMVITAVGFHLGVWAFVLGLAVTGWAETAQLVRERTRTIKSQQAVEAAHALGASRGQIFFLHILPQVMPMIWMLLAFEISNTLVTTAGLGFLGYYLGGAVFTEVDDFVYQRISEMPELGQMLATAWMVLDEPWAMVAAGTVVFLIVLAFNLVGEGLQQRLTRHLGGTRRLYKAIAGEALPAFDARIAAPVGRLFQQRGARIAGVLLLIVVMGAGMAWWRGQRTAPAAPAQQTATAQGMSASAASPAVPGESGTPTPPAQPESQLPVPGGHIYANEGHDPWLTRWVDFSGPVTTTVQWVFEADAFSGGPAIDATGTIYVPAKDGTIYALDGDGNVKWTANVGNQPVGTPALSADGTLYVADKEGLNALSPSGEILWHVVPEGAKTPTAGPIVSPEGHVYYKSVEGLNAVLPTGDLKWRTVLTETAKDFPPRLSPDGQTIFWEDLAFRTADGTPHSVDITALLNVSLPENTDGEGTLSNPRLGAVVGADGKLYHRGATKLVEAVPEEAAESAPAASALVALDWSIHDSLFNCEQAGITPLGHAWLTCRISFGLGFNWADVRGDLNSKIKLIGKRKLHIAGVDVEDVAYVCGDSYENVSECLALVPASNQAQWRVSLPGVKAISGVALAPGRLYVASWDGKLFALGENKARLPGADTATTQSGSLPVPGGHLWGTARHDPWGTLWSGAVGLQQAEVAWTFDADTAFSGGPAVAADGTLYLATEGGTLYALRSGGEVVWETSLVTGAVGAPALSAEGMLYVVDLEGGLSAFTATGEARWHLQPEDAGRGYTGPMVAPEGSIYYLFTRSGKLVVHAVTAAGKTQWKIAFDFSIYDAPPALSPSGAWLFWDNHVLSVADGAELAPFLETDVSQYFTGADAEAYARTDVTLNPLQATETGLALAQEVGWWLFGTEAQDQLDHPRDAGVTPNGLGWLLGDFSFGVGTHVAWGPVGLSEITEVVGNVRISRLGHPFVLAVDQDATLYVCGDTGSRRAHACYALAPDAEEPLWQFEFETEDKVSGGALVPERLYIATQSGRLYALGGQAGATPTASPSTSPTLTSTALVDPGPAWAKPENPGNHLWPMPRRDAWGTRWMEGNGPQQATLRWTYENAAGFSGGPVVAADGTLYVGTRAGTLLALAPNGDIQWVGKLSGSAQSTPAIGADGAVYVTDSDGYLFAFNPDGSLRWQHHGSGIITQTLRGIAQPTPLDGLGPAGTGPLVTPKGIYYTLATDTQRHGPDLYVRAEVMMAVSPEGTSLPGDPQFVWSERITPRLLAGTDALLWGTRFLSAEGSQLVTGFYNHLNRLQESYKNLDIYTFNGANGRVYLSYRRTFETCFLTAAGVGLSRTFQWEPDPSPGSIRDLGATPEGQVWMFFGSGKFIWVDPDDTVHGPVRFPLESQVIAVDGQSRVYGCGSSLGKAPECMAFAVGDPEPLWHITLDEGDKILEGALVPGTLYVTTEDGRLHALGE